MAKMLSGEHRSNNHMYVFSFFHCFAFQPCTRKNLQHFLGRVRAQICGPQVQGFVLLRSLTRKHSICRRNGRAHELRETENKYDTGEQFTAFVRESEISFESWLVSIYCTVKISQRYASSLCFVFDAGIIRYFIKRERNYPELPQPPLFLIPQ